MEVVASLSQGRTAAAQCGLFTYKSVLVIFEPPCTIPLNFYVLLNKEITCFLVCPETGMCHFIQFYIL